MSLKKMYNTVICGMLVLLIVIITLLFNFGALIDRSRNLTQDGINLISLSHDMLHVNDYLAKLIRVFVSKNDPVLLDEYYSLHNFDNLEGKLGKMIDIGLTEDETAQVDELLTLLNKLARIEARAIEACHAGDSETAARIIFSDEYKDTDFLLAHKTTALIADITNRVNLGVADIQEQLRSRELFIRIFTVLSIACFVVLQIMQSNRVLKPISEVAGLMSNVARGITGERLVKKHNDEIGTLFDHVNKTADSIEAYMADAEKSLNILKNILDGIDASIHVTIPQTGEILFVNKHMKSAFNIEGDGIGQYCYKVLQSDMDKRCEFCPCFELDKRPGAVIVWEDHNTKTNRFYQKTNRYIDWPGVANAHLQHSVDITDLKKFADDKLAAERMALEMKHEKEKAENAAKAKSDFLAKMSHEIRTPMNAVMGMSEIILRKNLPQDIYENAFGIKSASMNLLSIINDILDFSKIESGMMEIVETEYLLPSLINDVIGIIRIRIIDKPVQFVVDIDPGIPSVLIGDEVRVRQVLINILGNAVKYTHEGYVSLTVTGTVGTNEVVLSINIADSGVGVKEEDIGKLFGDFVQIDAEKNKGIVGTGLGLAISRNLCQLMGGDITLQSEYGKGSTFTITLPQKFESYEPFAVLKEPEKKLVLLYETRRVYRDSLIRAFENLGVAYKSVENIPALFEELEPCTHLFISSFMYGSINPAISKFEKFPELILLSDITENIAPKDIRILVLPAHTLSIANILNDVYEKNEMTNVVGVSFAAPDAKVLVVDDIAANLKVCEGLLLPYEMQLTLCSNGRDALKLVADNQYDLVFMDHMMPEMDGLEVTRHIRAMDGEYFQKLPIIALTANAVSGVREMFIQNGMNDFLAKPIETTKLDVILARWIPKEKWQAAAVPDSDEQMSYFVNLLKSVPELSVDKAIGVVGGSSTTYERMVRLSVNLLPENIERLDNLIGTSLPNYAIEVHGIKGVLNNIGAYMLGAQAFELEVLSKEGDVYACNALHPSFIEQLLKFLHTMQSLVNEASAVTKPEGDMMFLLRALPQLEDAAEFCDNVAALRVIESIDKYTYGLAIDETILELTHAVERFDFDAAITLIEKLKDGLCEWAR